MPPDSCRSVFPAAIASLSLASLFLRNKKKRVLTKQMFLQISAIQRHRSFLFLNRAVRTRIIDPPDLKRFVPLYFSRSNSKKYLVNLVRAWFERVYTQIINTSSVSPVVYSWYLNRCSRNVRREQCIICLQLGVQPRDCLDAIRSFELINGVDLFLRSSSPNVKIFPFPWNEIRSARKSASNQLADIVPSSKEANNNFLFTANRLV